MCGICGFIGNPKHPDVTFDLINSLMIKTERRGEHATGFWCAMPGNDKRIVWHKEPVKSSTFVDRKIWKDVEHYEPNILIGHCRYSSPGVGSEKVNKNNHPHVSADCRVALVHNGRVPEYSYLKNQYDVRTECDSEILLKIFESGEDFHDQEEFLRNQFPKVSSDMDVEKLYRLYGLRDIFAKVNFGSMSVAIGERRDNAERTLWLFHNKLRPLTLIDLRPQLGQIFFCSEPEIFRAAHDSSYIAKQFIDMDQAVLSVADEFIFYFNVTKDGSIQTDRFKVNKKRRYGYWDHLINIKKDEEDGKIKKSDTPLVRSSCEIISQLNDETEVIEECEQPKIETKISSTSHTSLVTTRDNHQPFNKLDTSHLRHVNSGQKHSSSHIGDLDEEEDHTRPFTSNDNKNDDTDLEDASEILTRGTTVKDSAIHKDNGFQEIDTTKSNVFYRNSTSDDEMSPKIDEEDVVRLEQVCDQIIDTINKIKTNGRNMAKEQSIDYSNFQELIDEMESLIKDIEGTIISIGV